MNKAITDGLVFMPAAFEFGLDQWSSGDGTPGSDTYDNAPNAAFVPSDQDFGGCIEMLKTEFDVQKLRYMGQTPLLPGCYLRITARIKAIAGNLPSIRIAGWAAGTNGAHIDGLVEVGPSVTLQSYGNIVEVSAIVGTGTRNGVDMAWGSDAIYGHFGLDLTGPAGGVVRIDDLIIEDISSAFLRDMFDVVDIRDYGAIGDGLTDAALALEAADAAANGRVVLVPAGTYFLDRNVTIDSRIRFEGRVVMPTNRRLSLRKNFDLPTYIEAFKDEQIALEKALQALMNSVDHESLDMGGRRVQIDRPVDVQAAVENRDAYEIRRVLRNGQIEASASSNWDTIVVSSSASYAIQNPTTLSNVANVANIEVGSLIEGNGVGREVYVSDRNISAGTLTLSKPLYGASSSQTYSFKRFKYLIDFIGFERSSRFVLDSLELQCSGRCSGVMLAKGGSIFEIINCTINKPMDRGITSTGTACQGMIIDGCQFLSNETSVRVQDRTTIGLNANANDVKIRNSRVMKFKHFAVLGGTGNLIVGNHWFQGDDEPNGLGIGGMIFTTPNVKTAITGNYIDNNFIEWTNEHDATPEYAAQFSFGGMTVTGNIFTCNDVTKDFNFFVVKPYGAGHFIHGLNLSCNVFKSLNGNITRVEKVDDSFAELNYLRMRNVVIEANTFNSVDEQTQNPVSLKHQQNSDQRSWTIPFAPYLPFGGRARWCEGIVADGPIISGSNNQVFATPYADLNQGSNNDQIRLTWPQACRGNVMITARVDNPQ
ncbi:glycosyl hydrolase family 28-related protein [Parasulfitobacter algicola]|uniref:Right-handed parallel beta-helix repeat-containing protein n=1 Tax=Parasulfitobacter algicola TaxID=2614809 RepID=A0ABX2IN62_9RHOB|nr:glycosyl hydrolase family 28-related protein [Sulfitobacter algicola]NSX54319.1 right-handed parallel beta-helix repeat-containing protein [Sulfitobacter algicola]